MSIFLIIFSLFFKILVRSALFIVFGAVFLFTFSYAEQSHAEPAGQTNFVDGLLQNTDQKLKLNKINKDIDDYKPSDLVNLRSSSPDVSQDDGVAEIFIRSVVIEGASVFSRSEFSVCYRPIIGRSITPQELNGLSICMTKIYTDAGYPLSRVVIPPQDIPNGRLRVKVVEGYISSYEIVGGDGASFNVKPFMSVLMQERPLTQKTFERQLLLISDIPGVSIKDTALDETKEFSGGYELTLEVETSRLFSNGELDNRGTKDVGPYQSFQSVYLNSAFGRGESIGLSYSSIPFEADELQYGSVSVDLPLNEYGLRFYSSFSLSDTRPSDFRKLIDTRYRNLMFNSQLEWTLKREREFSVWGGVGVWASRNQWENDFGRFVNDEMAGISLFGRANFADKFGGQNYVYGTLRQGLDLGDVTRQDDDDKSRFDGDGVFTKLSVDYIREQPLIDNWSLKFDGAMQWASQGLLSGEEFYLGGFRFGRGFESGIVGGDSGLGASIELQYTKDLNMSFLKGEQLYSFVDMGWIFDDGDEFIDDIFISSAGGGARLYFDYGLSAEFEVAFPLEDAGLEEIDDTQFFFKINRHFKMDELSMASFWKSSPFSGFQSSEVY